MSIGKSNLMKLYMFFLVIFLFLTLFFWFSPGHMKELSILYLWPIAVAIPAVSVVVDQKRVLSTYIAYAFSIWIWLTCVWNGDYALQYNSHFVLGIVIPFCVFYPAFLVMEDRHADRYFRLVGMAYIGFTLFIAGLSLYAVFVSRWVYSPFSDRLIGLQDGRLYILAYHPNEISSVYCIALLLSAYLAMVAKKLPAKLVFALCALVDYLMIVLTNTRTGIIIISLAVAAYLFFRLFQAMRKNRLAVRIAVCAVLSAAVVVLSYQSFLWTNQLISSMIAKDSSVTSRFTLIAEASAQEEKAAEGAAAQEAAGPGGEEQLINRDFLSDLGTFSLRTEIWGAGLRYIQERPITLLIGSLDSQVALIPIRMLGRDVYHMHNCLMEALLLGGIPGLLLYGFLLLQIVWHAVRLMLYSRSTMAMRFLACIPLLMLINGMMEIYPSFSGNVMDMMFLLISGYVVMQARRLPAEKRL